MTLSFRSRTKHRHSNPSTNNAILPKLITSSSSHLHLPHIIPTPIQTVTSHSHLPKIKCKLPHFAPKRKHLPIARPPRVLPSRKPGPAHDKNAHQIRWEMCLMIRCATNNVGISQVSRRLAQGHEPEPATVRSEFGQS